MLGSVDCRAHLAYLMGDLEQMTSLQVEAVGIARTLGDDRALATTVLNLGGAYEVAGDYARARAALEEALALDRERGDRGDVAHDLHDLGWIAIHQEDFDEAQDLFTTALPVLAELGRRDAVARALGGLAAVAVDDADFVRAARLKGAADKLLFEIGGRNDAHIDEERERYIERPLHERAEYDLRQARDEGHNMTLKQAIAYGLQDDLASGSALAE